jgi:hypothetical protein
MADNLNLLIAAGAAAAVLGGLYVLLGGKKKGPVCALERACAPARSDAACVPHAGVPRQDAPEGAAAQEDQAVARHVPVSFRAAHTKPHPGPPSRQALQGRPERKTRSCSALRASELRDVCRMRSSSAADRPCVSQYVCGRGASADAGRGRGAQIFGPMPKPKESNEWNGREDAEQVCDG